MPPLSPLPLGALPRRGEWCSREDSNLHRITYMVLNHTRLPFRHMSKYAAKRVVSLHGFREGTTGNFSEFAFIGA